MRYIFKSLGLSESDVTIVQIGDNPSRMAAMKTNAIQATVFTIAEYGSGEKSRLSFPSSTLTNSGLKFHGSGIARPALSCATTGPWWNSSSRVFSKESRLRNSTKKKASRLIMDFMKLKDQDEAEETYQVIIQEIQPRKPYPLKEGVETVLRNIESTVPKAKTVKAEDLIDDSVLRQHRPKRLHR